MTGPPVAARERLPCLLGQGRGTALLAATSGGVGTARGEPCTDKHLEVEAHRVGVQAGVRCDPRYIQRGAAAP
jgi:hypothetical protein